MNINDHGKVMRDAQPLHDTASVSRIGIRKDALGVEYGPASHPRPGRAQYNSPAEHRERIGDNRRRPLDIQVADRATLCRSV